VISTFEELDDDFEHFVISSDKSKDCEKLPNASNTSNSTSSSFAGASESKSIMSNTTMSSMAMPQINRQKSIDLENNFPVASASTLCNGILQPSHYYHNSNRIHFPNTHNRKLTLFDRQNHFSFDEHDSKNNDNNNNNVNNNNTNENKNNPQVVFEHIQEDIEDFNQNFIQMPPLNNNFKNSKRNNINASDMMTMQRKYFHNYDYDNKKDFHCKEEKETEDSMCAHYHHYHRKLKIPATEFKDNNAKAMPMDQISKIRPTPITDVDHVVYFDHGPCRTSQ